MEGTTELTDIPAFHKNAEKLKKLLKLLSDKKCLLPILNKSLDEEGGRLVLEIGNEFVNDGGVEESTFVARGYGNAEEGKGAIGIIGPKRMDYPYMLGLLVYFTQTLKGRIVGSR